MLKGKPDYKFDAMGLRVWIVKLYAMQSIEADEKGNFPITYMNGKSTTAAQAAGTHKGLTSDFYHACRCGVIDFQGFQFHIPLLPGKVIEDYTP